MSKVLGVDLGERRIGVALSDDTGLLAFPLTALSRSDLGSDISRILETAKKHRVTEIVVGMPLSLTGKRGPQAHSTNRFIAVLTENTSIPIKTFDERLSTIEAERLLHQTGNRPSRDRGRLDAAAAAVILQRYLDSRKESE